LSNAATSNSAVGPKSAIPALLIRSVDVACQSLQAGWVAEVGSGEAGLAAGGSDLLDRLRPARGVAAVNHDLRPVPGQLQRDRATDARGRALHQRALPFEVHLSSHRHCCSFVRHVDKGLAYSSGGLIACTRCLSQRATTRQPRRAAPDQEWR
jgi:hypothetical protein